MATKRKKEARRIRRREQRRAGLRRTVADDLWRGDASPDEETSPTCRAPHTVPAEFRILEAETESDFRLLEAAAGGGGEGAPALQRFTMTAYTGGKLYLSGFPFPVVADLSGMRISAKARPILRDHSLAQIVGHTEAIDINQSSIRLTGVISAANAYAREVADSAENGFPWQASIGAIASKVSFVDQGERVEVNGRKFTGPLYVARQSVLREISFVALGADDKTSARLAADGHEHGEASTGEIGRRRLVQDGSPGRDAFLQDECSSTNRPRRIGVTDMGFEEWLRAMGFDCDDLDARQTAGLQALYEEGGAPSGEGGGSEAFRSDTAETETTPVQAATAATTTAAGSAPATAPGNATTAAPPAPPFAEGTSSDDPVRALRAKWAAERRRIAEIGDLCAGEHTEIEAQAIEEGWDKNRTELALLRVARPQAPAVGSQTSALSTTTLEAAACLAAGVAETDLLKDYGERTLEAASPLRDIGLKELVAECARLEGISVPRVFGDGSETIRAGFSTISLPGILENVMNKTLLASYQATSIAALELCAVGTVSDFKEVSRYRLLGTGGFEQVSPDGELQHGQLGEQKFGNKADTYGQILMLTRQDIINDDLEAFLGITRQMGRSGAELIDDLFFELLLSNPGSFFSSGHGNFQSGAATAFDSTSLTTAKTLFRKQKAGPGTKAKDQKPINVRPELLVVPVELETDAELLMGSAQLMIDGAGTETKFPVDNPHRNKYRVVSPPHLSDSYYTGSSAKAWYLFAEPNVLPAFEIVFLGGRRTPVIERVEALPNMLGMGFRSYIDVGVREQDWRGAVKMAGE